jgi:hypothetical protein
MLQQPGASGGGGCLGGLGPYRRQRQAEQEGQSQQPQQQPRESVRILVLGDERVGKSSLVSAFVSQCFPEKVSRAVGLGWNRFDPLSPYQSHTHPTAVECLSAIISSPCKPQPPSTKQVPSVLTPVQIPASESPDNVATLIVDTAADAPSEHLVARIKVRFALLGVCLTGGWEGWNGSIYVDGWSGWIGPSPSHPSLTHASIPQQ